LTSEGAKRASPVDHNSSMQAELSAQAIRALVNRKARIDQAARALEIFNVTTSDDAIAERHLLQIMKRNVDHAQQVFEAEIAALSREERWRFMFECMLTGVLDDELI